ncbi:uncharacterized protein LJ206_004973 [Theristicus caerulescens]
MQRCKEEADILGGSACLQQRNWRKPKPGERIEGFAMQSSVEDRIPQRQQHLFEMNILNVLGATVALEEGYPCECNKCPPRMQPKTRAWIQHEGQLKSTWVKVRDPDGNANKPTKAPGSSLRTPGL